MRPLTLIERAKSFRTRKSLGQNFLVSESTLNEIADKIAESGLKQIVEIGPGIGFLTDKLLERNLKVKAIDLDSVALSEIFPHSRLEKINCDALHFDFNVLNEPCGAAGNLPFNVGTQILLRLIGDWDDPNWAFPQIQDMVLMFQLELAQRLTAKPSSKAYNPLSLLIQAKSEIEFCFRVPAKDFWPIPKVEAGVVHLKPKANGILHSLKTEERLLLKKIIGQAFSSRRKNIKNCLASFFSAEQLLARGIEPNKRAENLELADFIRLATY